jgi:hypothetical protein
MSVNDFVVKYNGKWVEEAGTSALNQCVDLANRWIREGLGLPIIEWTNAVDFPSKAGPAYDYILNTPTNIPQEGDLMIWGGNIYGHIAIFIEGNVDTFRSFDENYPTGSNCHIQNHTYANVKGWLRKKVASTPDTTCQKDLDTCRVDRDGNHNDRMALYEELGFTGVFNRTIAVEKIRQLLALEKQFVEKDGQLVTANSQISALEVRIIELTEKNEELVLSQAKLNDKTALQQKTIDNQGSEIKILSNSIQELKTQVQIPTNIPKTGFKRLIYNWLIKV